MAAVVHDVVIEGGDAVREPIVAHELPHVLDRIEFGTFGRQRQGVMLAGMSSFPDMCHPD
ncbi:hypothetical protein GCM10011614_35170 [Novosphingobium colocasiae]|uniref:Uncharacterized protein n=1 Tax=Novosphingobium colocasiae TaxID=1256513 RepID=A0A918PNR9_9SPHN|nr:hypothetical protein GCM10011614_35170 [Novosphingobium colocasiae]